MAPVSSTKDKEKTPIAIDKNSQNVISRLESKYSDILDRVAKRKEKQRQQQLDDHEKTLEPENSRMANPLMKSATTANISKTSFGSSLSTSQKERTPFRLERNKHKYSNSNLNSDNFDSISNGSGISSSSASTSKMKRSDLLASAGSSNDISYNKLKSHDSGYYDGNYFKTKYDDLLSDVSSNRHTPKKTTAYTGSSTSRQLRPYKRTDSSSGDKHRTAINLYEMLENEEKSNGTSSGSSSSYRRQYSQRKSTGKGLRTTYNDNLSTTDDSSDDFSDFEKTERENRRKEIQSLIQKYAQLDDFYGKPRDENNNSTSSKNDRNIDPWDMKVQSPVVIPMKSSNNKPSSSSSSLNQFNALGKSQTMANIIPPHYQSNYDFDSSWYGSNYNNSSKNKGSNIVPITTFAQKSSSKSRMSKALSTFVRTATIFFYRFYPKKQTNFVPFVSFLFF